MTQNNSLTTIDAQDADITRNVGETSLTPGESTTVELSVEYEDELGEMEMLRIDDQFSPAFAAVELNQISPAGGTGGSGSDGDDFIAVWKEDADSYTVSYHVTVPDDVVGEFTLSGTLEVGDTETALPEETITVDGPVSTTITLQNIGDSTWQVTDIDGDDATADLNVDNPAIELEPNTRYEIINQGWDTHPLAFEAADGTALLSQDGEGSYETDESVDWVDDNETVEFTLTESLANELSTYVCTVHGSMEGSIGTDDEEPGDTDENPVVVGNPASDTTGDGLLNDVNGDGEFTISDVQAFFENLDSEAVQNNPERFDFSGTGGDVGIADVQALFEQFQST